MGYDVGDRIASEERTDQSGQRLVLRVGVGDVLGSFEFDSHGEIIAARKKVEALLAIHEEINVLLEDNFPEAASDGSAFTFAESVLLKNAEAQSDLAASLSVWKAEGNATIPEFFKKDQGATIKKMGASIEMLAKISDAIAANQMEVTGWDKFIRSFVPVVIDHLRENTKRSIEK